MTTGDINMNVSLTPTLEEYVRRKVETGLYNTASEVVREALRNFMNQELIAKNAVQKEPPVKQEIVEKLKSLEQPLRERYITSLSLFGSIARGHGQAESDIDILIDFDRNSNFDIVDLVGVEKFLEEYLYRKVEVMTKDSVKPRLKDSIFRDAEKIF